MKQETSSKQSIHSKNSNYMCFGALESCNQVTLCLMDMSRSIKHVICLAFWPFADLIGPTSNTLHWLFFDEYTLRWF